MNQINSNQQFDNMNIINNPNFNNPNMNMGMDNSNYQFNMNQNQNQFQNFQMNTQQQNMNMNNANNNQMNYTNNSVPLKLASGTGLKEDEINCIIDSARESLNKREDPLSKAIINKVKNKIGGDWVIFAYVNGLKGYDLSVSIGEKDRMLSFDIDNFRFQVIKIGD